MTVPELLKAWRVASGLTQERAAGLVGVSQPAWSKYESVEAGPCGVDARIAYGIISATEGTKHEVTLRMLADLCEKPGAGEAKQKVRASHRHRDNAPRRTGRKPPKRSVRLGAS